MQRNEDNSNRESLPDAPGTGASPGTTLPPTDGAPGSASAFRTQSESSEASFGHFHLIEKIGEGGMGVVYRARDGERNQLVALKTLQRMSPAGLSRFKQEFRILADLSHRNLVTLYELFKDGERWCFTMELVEGVPFMRYLAGGDESTSLADAERLERLRDAFSQLCDGLGALHGAGKIHRDVKPSNVLVSPEGRVVLLDFGLAAELGPSGNTQSTTAPLIGTIGYMSPEQAGGEPVSFASDLYSMGVMLYQALTGHMPFEGSVIEILRAKSDHEPVPPAMLNSGIPEDLNALCVELLRRNPTERPSPPDVKVRLGRSSRQGKPAAPEHHNPQYAPFVGRGNELGALHEAYRATRAGTPVIVHVRGVSGAGKTALVQRFLAEISADPRVLILSGRCFEQESVPFKALDNLLDSTTRYLRRLPDAEVKALLPRDFRALARVFPVLRQVECIADAPPASSELVDPVELRRRASTALRELFARIGDRRPLVLSIDDLQWGDLDSAKLLTDLLMPPDPPLFLAIGCCRSEDAAASPFFKYLRQMHSGSNISFDEREITVDRIESNDIRSLTLKLLETLDTDREALAEAIIRESAGRPFLVYELVEYVKACADGLNLKNPLTLDEALWQRIQQLPEDPRRLLEIVAVAGRPIGVEEASSAAGLTTNVRIALPVLRTGRLIRITSTDGGRQIEAYHDRVRECVMAHFSAQTLQDRHRRLADSYAASAELDSEIMALHLSGAGMPEQAAIYYEKAAGAAANALAFDHAAVLYRRALDLKQWTDEERCRLETSLGDAWSKAGRGADAARMYLSAAERTDAGFSLELQRRAALQLLTSGHVDEGIARLAPVLDSIGTRLARAPWRALLSLLLRRTQLRLRGLDFSPHREETIEADVKQRIDIGWSVVVGLSVVDPIRGAAFQTRSLLLALGAGEPFRVARALATEAGHLASSGAIARARLVLDRAEPHARQTGNSYAIGMVEMARGTVDYFDEKWPQALQFSRKAEATFRQHCTGVAWEIDTAIAFSLWSLAKMGEIAELSRACPALLKEARERGDLYAETNLSTQIMAMVRLGADNLEGLQEELRRVMDKWSQQSYHVQHHDALLAYVLVELYCGNPRAAWDRVQKEWSAFRWSLLSHVQDLLIEMLQLRAYCALAIAATSREPAAFLATAARDARRLRRQKLPWTIALANYIDGGVAAIRGDVAIASNRLAAAVSGFDAVHAHLFAAAARCRLSPLIGEAEGRDMRNAAGAWFESQMIKNPSRMTAVYAPGFDTT